MLSSNFGYPVSEGAKLITPDPEFLPFELDTNGLEVIRERQVFHTGQNGMDELFCAGCNQNIANENLDFLNEWGDHKSNNLTCPLCNAATEIHHYKFIPEWGFSNLGFTFWNWPRFTDAFIADFKQQLGCDIDLVYTWV